MSRSGYSEDYDDYASLNLYRANVDRAINGKRGQAFLRELIAALDALPEKKLIARSFADTDGVCALGSVARMRGVTEKLPKMSEDLDIGEQAAKVLGIAECMAREIMYENDEHYAYWKDPSEGDELRWERIRRWAAAQVKP
jgi:hypothetical protein